MGPRCPIALALAITAAIPSATAQETAPSGRPAPTAQDQFDALVKEIGALRADLDGLDRHERTLVNEMDRLEVESALRAREVERLSALRQRTVRELERTRLTLQARRAEVERQEAALARQIRSAYEMGRSREVRLVLWLAEPVDVMRAVAYIDMMVQRQAGLVASLKQGRGEMEALERSLAAQAAGLEDLAAQQRARAFELAEVRRKAAVLLETTRQQREAHRRAIAELTRAAEELESAIVSDAGGRIAIPAIDVENLRGALEWPVPGEIAVPFGEIRNPKFGTAVPHPGLDIRTGPRAPIRAVLPGRVVFSRRFTGYGNTVLLDHGGRWLSVYARAAVVSVTEGEQVLPGQVLGFSGEQAFDNAGPTVYFELRRDGRAVDPAQWLKRKAAPRREESR